MKKKKKSTRSILLIGSTSECSDIVYLTGFAAPDPVVLLVRPGGRHLVVPTLEQNRASRCMKKGTVSTPDGLGLTRSKRRKLSEWALALVRKERVRSVSVPSRFPVGIARKLEESGIRVHVSEDSLFPERAVKTPDEIRKITESQQAAVLALRAGVELIRSAVPGKDGILLWENKPLTSEKVRQRMMGLLLDHNCLGRDLIVAGGPAAADPHEQGSGPLRSGEAIVIDVFPQHLDHRYWGDLTRTVVKGTAPTELRRMYRAVHAAQNEALAHIKPGVKLSTVHNAVVAEFERRGYGAETRQKRPVGFIHSTGHGVGLDIHEGPVLGNADGRLRKGHVVTVEPGLYYPEIGGIRIEDTIVVTGTGWRYLVPCEKRFEV